MEWDLFLNDDSFKAQTTEEADELLYEQLGSRLMETLAELREEAGLGEEFKR